MLRKYFKKITDKRESYKVRHNLLETLIMAICAVIAECETFYQIEEYCQEKEEWFREKLGLKLNHGIPSHDTFERIFAMIDPKEFETSFISWIKAANRLTQGTIVSIDGKSICGSGSDEQRPIHMVSAWANENKLVLGQIKTDEKSNEITAIPALLELLELKGCIVTIDAMGCQRDISAKIAEKQADYVFGLKGNQSNLHDDVRLYFDDAQKNRKQYPEISITGSLEKGHGRIEKRNYFFSTDISWLEQRGNWSNLNAIGMVESIVEEKGKTRRETRYFITSLVEITPFAKAVREHWGIENSLHWCLDVGFNEDNCRIRKDNSAENMAVVRHIAINLLKQDNSFKGASIKAKRHKCAYSESYLHKILFQSIGL